MKSDLCLIPHSKVNSKLVKHLYLYLSPKTLKLLKENRAKNFMTLDSAMIYQMLYKKHRQQKKQYTNASIPNQNFYASEHTIKKVKRQIIE